MPIAKNSWKVLENALEVQDLQNCCKIGKVYDCFWVGSKFGWPTISTWISLPPLWSNGLHCIKFIQSYRESNIESISWWITCPSEEVAMLWPPDRAVCFVGGYPLSWFPNLVDCNLLNVVMIEFYRGQVLCHLWGVQKRWNLWSSSSTLNIGCKPWKGGILCSKAFSPIPLVMV